VSQEIIIFIIMVGVFMLGCFLLKFPVSVSMMLASIMGAVFGLILEGQPLDLRQLVEGPFSMLDTILVISTAMIFMKVIENSGALEALSVTIIKRFHKHPAILLILIMLVVMFPGMITGSSTAAVLSAGSIMAPVLVLMGLDKVSAASIIAMGGLLGMIAPPVNLPAMIIGGGIDTPYVGFAVPLLILTLPLAVFSALYLGLKSAKAMKYDEVKEHLNFEIGEKYGFRLYIPIIVLVVIMLLAKVAKVIYDPGMPLMFLISAAIGFFTGKKINVFYTILSALHDALPVMGILMGVGMFIQIMTLTGVRGLIVVFCLSIPPAMLYLAAAISIPLFGAVSSFGAATVLGVPFALAFLNHNTIITISALSLIASLGDMMPPTALAGMFAAQVMGLPKYTDVLKRCMLPMLVLLVYSVVIILCSNQLALILP